MGNEQISHNSLYVSSKPIFKEEKVVDVDEIIKRIDAKLAENYTREIGHLSRAINGKIQRKY